MSFEQLLFSFEGRIRRSHWWAARLSLGGVVLVLALVGMAVVRMVGPHPDALNAALLGLAVLILAPLVLWIDLALCVKRLHDLGWTGWLVLAIFVPYLGGLFSLICMGIMDGNPERNQFGPSPKFPEQEAEVFA